MPRDHDERDDWVRWALRGVLAFVLWQGWLINNAVVELRVEVEALKRENQLRTASIKSLWERTAKKSGAVADASEIAAAAPSEHGTIEPVKP
jgi:hypothetical protein